MFSKNYWIVPDKYKNGTRFVFVSACVHLVGTSLLAKVVNDNAGSLTPNVALRFFASKLAPTRSRTRGRHHGPSRTDCHRPGQTRRG
ncbi:hypothetical protein CEC48_08435 [Pseudomonas sp. K2I15]|nr:hypothetical protein CEC48_08435 [Pseudomonas sp. K2I15]